jgi:hypothetical protein
MEELIPWLYLKGISTNDFTDVLAALAGKDSDKSKLHIEFCKIES